MATVRASYYGGAAAEPAGVTAETGIKFNRADDQAGTGAPVPIPQSAGTNFSWIKNLALEVTTGGATAISNRRISMSAAATTGLFLHFKATTYAQPASGNKPTDDATTNGVTPSTFTAMTTSTQVYDAASVSASSTGRNGSIVQVVAGVDNTYTGSPGNNTTLPTIRLTYDEA